MSKDKSPLPRRAFVGLLGAGAIGAGAAAAAHAQGDGGWKPAMEPQDEWMELPGRHRFVLDATSAEGAGEALLYTGNYFRANEQAYGLKPDDLAVVLILRHFATPFAYTDAMWAKYGAAFSQALEFKDPKSDAAPVINLYNAPGYGGQLENRGVTLSSLIDKKVQFAVCGMATAAMAGIAARATGGDAKAIEAELIANLIPNSHMTAAGIVAVNRAQERGYALAYVG